MYIYIFFLRDPGHSKSKNFPLFFATLAFFRKTCTEVQMWKEIVLGSLHLFSDPKKGQTFRNTRTGHNFAHNYHDYFPQLAAVLFMWCDRAPKLAVMCDRVLALRQTYFYSSVNQNTSCIIHSNDRIPAVFYLFEEKSMSFRQNRPQGSSKK